MMTIEVLVAAMNQNDFSLIEQMNLKTDAIIANQCDQCYNETISKNGKKYFYINRPDRGVGLNRNEALLHATSDILTFADDDMVFIDEYEQVIQRAFKEIPDADAIIFNIKTIGKDVGRRINSKVKRVHFYNALNYGAARISVKSTSIKRENILFHTCFGGGTRYSAGEDTLFIVNMIKHGLKIYTYPVCIGAVDQTISTWFKGYNEKFLFDKGALYAAISKHFAGVLCLLDILRHRKLYINFTFMEAYKTMKDGMSAYRDLNEYKTENTCGEE